MTWIAWAFLLVLQNFAFTWTSRARNSGSVVYGATASVFSNGIWFVGQMFIFNQLLQVRESGAWGLMVGSMVFYTIFTMIGSTTAHWFFMNVIEEKFRKRQVGAR